MGAEFCPLLIRHRHYNKNYNRRPVQVRGGPILQIVGFVVNDLSMTQLGVVFARLDSR